MNPQTVTHRVAGWFAIADARELIGAFERLGFTIDRLTISGPWNIGGEIIGIQPHNVGVPKRNKVEIAPGVFAGPTEFSVIEITGLLGEEPDHARD